MTAIEVFLALVALWLVCAVINAGLSYAYFTSKFPLSSDAREDLGFAIGWGCFVAILGPIGVFLALCMTGFAKHGWRLK